MELAIIITLGLLLIVSGYTTFNLMFKTEKQEDALEIQAETINHQNKFVTKLSESINNCSERLKIIDAKGSFKSDDEIGWFFEEIKYMQESLDQFITKPEEDGENKA